MYFVNFSFFFFFIINFFLLTIVFILFSGHLIIVLIFLDILVLASVFLLVFYTTVTSQTVGYTYALLLLGVAAADTAVGLGILLLYYKKQKNKETLLENITPPTNV